MFKAWQSITLWKRVLVGLFFGLAIGLAVRYTAPASREVAEVGIAVQDPAAVDEKASEDLKTTVDKALTFNVVKGGWMSNNGTLLETPSALHGEVLVGEDNEITYTPSANFKGVDTITLVANEPYANAIKIGKTWFKPFGDLFVRLIKMLIIPLIATTLVAGVTAMGDPKKLGSLGIKTIALYLATTFFAVSLGLVVGTILKPGAGIDFQTAGSGAVEAVEGKITSAKESGTMVDRLLEIVPSNPVQALAEGDVLPTIFFAIMIGIGILLAGKAGEPVKRFFESAAEVVMKVTVLIMELAPYGVLALMAWVMSTRGIEVLSNLLWLSLALYLACFLQIILVYGGLIIRGILRLPMVQFFKGVADAQGVAFSTASSSATLPMTISCAEKNLGVEKSVAGSVLPLGATINMDGTAIYLGLIALFAAQALGIEITATQYAMVALTATLVSIGAAGIPSAGLLLAATVLGVIDVSADDAVLIIAFIFPFDRLLDMMRTVTNVTGDIAVACTVAKWEGELDEKVFRTEASL
ncbi:cation:dicarboxylase symporter family transporter [bacterium]|nr:cation:dicarboxylase symporter family transporter [bacterium]